MVINDRKWSKNEGKVQCVQGLKNVKLNNLHIILPRHMFLYLTRSFIKYRSLCLIADMFNQSNLYFIKASQVFDLNNGDIGEGRELK